MRFFCVAKYLLGNTQDVYKRQDENGIEYNYYLPSGEDASDEDRETLIRQAVAEGANTIVCVGYLYGPALAWAATEYPDVHFIAVDVNGFDINSENGTIPENVFCVTFKEEEAGYLAGYAAVKDGFTKLGFLGGRAVPAVIRYGYGYVQGADAAAQEMGINVQMNYYYGGQFLSLIHIYPSGMLTESPACGSALRAMQKPASRNTAR